MTLHDRCLAYAKAFPQWPDSWPYVSPSGRWVYGHWAIGAMFKNASRYPGAYPRTYVDRVRALFPDVPESRVLHLFAGSMPKGRYTRVDVRADMQPEIVGSAYDLPALLAGRPKLVVDLVLCDPPYPGQAQRLYGTSEVETWRCFRAMAAALRPGAHVVWLSTAVPMYRASEWINWGSINVRRSTNQAVREALFFERRAA